jgi:hypothetical protein
MYVPASSYWKSLYVCASQPAVTGLDTTE